MKHVRLVANGPRHVTHSLPHNMKDALIEAEVASLEQNLILGHAMGGVGDRVYGGAPAKAQGHQEGNGTGTKDGVTSPNTPIDLSCFGKDPLSPAHWVREVTS